MVVYVLFCSVTCKLMLGALEKFNGILISRYKEVALFSVGLYQIYIFSNNIGIGLKDYGKVYSMKG